MIAIIGCGNANRTDDAAGLEVVRLLNSSRVLKAREDLHILDAGTNGLAVMFAARGCKTLIVVDSCWTGAEPGAIFEVPGAEVENRQMHSLSAHEFRWDHALHAGRQIYRDGFPEDVTAYLIEARSVDYGIGLSRDVREAAVVVANKITDRISLQASPVRQGELEI